MISWKPLWATVTHMGAEIVISSSLSAVSSQCVEALSTLSCKKRAAKNLKKTTCKVFTEVPESEEKFCPLNKMRLDVIWW